ncbi:nitroreductase/quinone reductase family protein [Actinoplanes sp. DH11]|uniref:nitroreductase/quinone reductase family protein n=1 Tax=Actinoplanes sp. DH11 TaxID=2857011 RepID=UPI001E33B790|nr:nitroreductase/quinone reductase family protein [Actinoplanes sp. DH11]
MPEQVHDSPLPFVAGHIRRFEQTGGRPRPGFDDLLLTTRGRRTGTLRRTALLHLRDDTGDRTTWIVAASNRGAGHHPAWYLNLLADPDVTVQVGTDTVPARARPATEEERARLWQRLITAMPVYRDYQAATTRQIPLVILTPRLSQNGRLASLLQHDP